MTKFKGYKEHEILGSHDRLCSDWTRRLEEVVDLC